MESCRHPAKTAAALLTLALLAVCAQASQTTIRNPTTFSAGTLCLIQQAADTCITNQTAVATAAADAYGIGLKLVTIPSSAATNPDDATFTEIETHLRSATAQAFLSDCSLFVGPRGLDLSLGLSIAANSALGHRPRVDYAMTTLNEGGDHASSSTGSNDDSNSGGGAENDSDRALLNIPMLPQRTDEGTHLTNVASFIGASSFSIVTTADAASVGTAARAVEHAKRLLQPTPQTIFLPRSHVATPAVMDLAVESVSATNTRFLVVIADSPWNPTVVEMLSRLRGEITANRELILSSSFCSNSTTQRDGDLFRGALCVGPGYFNHTHNAQLLFPVLPGCGYAADAVAYGALVVRNAATGAPISTNATRLGEVLFANRTKLASGYTGPIAFVKEAVPYYGANSSTPSMPARRAEALLSVSNVLPSGALVEIGIVGRDAPDTEAVHLDRPVAFRDGSSDLPSPEISSSSRSSAAAIALGVLLPVVVLIAVFAVSFRKPEKTKDNSCAPKDGTKPVTIIFTDVEKSTMLWEEIPEDMGEVIDMHHEIIRRLIRKYDGYEVKTVGDSFMVAFSDVMNAAQFMASIQTELLKHHFPRCVSDVYRGIYELKGMPYDNWGLRVRIGAHHGLCEIKEEGTGFDYYGNMVNCAARVEGVALGGQILVSNELADELKPHAGWSLKDLGPRHLKGINEPVPVSQLVPTGLEDRTFAEEPADATAADRDGAEDLTGDGDDFGRGADSVSLTGSAVTGASFQDSPSFLVVERLLSLTKGDKDVEAALKKINKSWRATGPTVQDALAIAVQRAYRSVMRKIQLGGGTTTGGDSMNSSMRGGFINNRAVQQQQQLQQQQRQRATGGGLGGLPPRSPRHANNSPRSPKHTLAASGDASN